MPAIEPRRQSERQSIPPAKAWRNLAILFVMLFGVGGFTYWWGAYKTYHYEAVQPAVLYRAGNQGLREFATAVRRSNSKTIVSLIDDQELADPAKPQFAQESDLAAKLSLKLVRVPVKLGGWPTSADVQAFLTAATDKNNQPVLVHCAQCVRRTGMMVAAYQMSVLGYDKARAIAGIESYGHSDRTIADVKKFIEIYDPASRAVTQTMSQSEE
ncbi:hypothetical protein BH10PLA1_BH10PLA1_10910 [soil metagenome]